MTTEDQIEVDEAQKLRAAIEVGFKNYERGSHFSYKNIGEALAQMRDGKAYKRLGFPTMDDVIKDMGKSRSICYAMMDYHDVITPNLAAYPALDQISVTNLTKYVIPWLKTKGESAENLDKVIEIAALGDIEQNDEIRRLRGKVAKVDCLHEETEAWIRCKVCSKFIRVTH